MAIQCANLFLLVLVAYCVQLGLCSTVALGSSCPVTGCTGLNNASCISGGCFCDPSFYQYDDYHCETRIVVGGSCSLTVADPLQCTDNAHCENTGSLTVCVLDSSPTATPGVQGTHSSQLAASTVPPGVQGNSHSSQLAASTGTYNSHSPGLAASTELSLSVMALWVMLHCTSGD